MKLWEKIAAGVPLATTALWVAFYPAYDSAVAAETPAYYIDANFGGVISDFMYVSTLIDPEVLTVIDGICASACTLYIQERLQINACITDAAILGFHKPYNFLATKEGEVIGIATGTEAAIQAEEEWRTIFFNWYPSGLQSILEPQTIPSVAAGASPFEMIWVKSRDLRGIIPACPSNWRDYKLAPFPSIRGHLPMERN